MIGKLKMIAAAAKVFAIAHAPAALFIGGLVVGAIAIYEVAKSAPEVAEKIEQHEDNLEQLNADIKSEETTEEQKENARVEKKKEVKAVAGCFLKGYWKAIVLSVIAACLLACGFLWQSRRFAIAAATAASQAATLKLVDSNIRKTYGDKAVFAMHDPNWDPGTLKREDKETPGLEGYDDPYRSYNVTKAVGSPINTTDDMYIYNKYTIDPEYYSSSSNNTTAFINNVIKIMETVANANRYINYEMRSPVLSRTTFLCDYLGFIFAGNGTCSDDIDIGMTTGWGKGEIIDVGITDIYKQVSQNMGNPYVLDELAEEYRDGIPLKLNCSLNARDNAICLPAYGNRGTVA